MPVDPQRLAETLARLVSIESVNPSLVEGAPGETAIATFVAGQLTELGLDVALHEHAHGRLSVVGRLTGAGGRSLMLNAHTDTVGAGAMEGAFEPRVEGGRLYGRGAYDMKGSLAACLEAVRALVEDGVTPPGDVLVAAVADEEHASLGTMDIAASYAVDAAIVTEPTDLAVCVAHKGFAWIEVETSGRAAHGSRYLEGIDANMAMGRVLGRLDELERALQGRTPHPLVGPPSLHAATLEGGSGWSTYADRCRLRIERRTIPGETAARVADEIADLVAEVAERGAAGAVTKTVLAREPFEVAEDAAIVRAVDAAAVSVLGATPDHVGASYWMDAALLAEAGVETVVIGPAGLGAHADVEWVDLASAAQVAEILLRVAQSYGR